MTKLKTISVNVRGIGSQHKRRDVIHYLNNMKCDIVLLQDTHLTKEKICSFESIWKGKAYHSCYTNNSRGTSILFNRNLQHESIREFTSNNGNYVLLQCKIGTDTYLIGSIYGPNRDEPQFYEHIGELLENVDSDHIIIGGDFNFIIDADNDCFGYVHENNVNARNKFISVCNKHGLIDVWRQHNPNEQQFTWLKSTPKKGARLDMFFVSSHLSSLCNDLQIIPGYRTDHNMITMCVQVGESQRGPGIWKFNESLLNDEEYVRVVDECIDRQIEQYSLPIYSYSFLSSTCNYKDIKFNINDDLFYETLLMMIRGETVRYSKRKAKRLKEKEKELITQIAHAHSTFSKDRSELNASRLEEYKEKLENVRKPHINGLIVRSRTRWHEDGEKSSKYFLGLEKEMQ